jgi:hypothetical protein
MERTLPVTPEVVKALAEAEMQWQSQCGGPSRTAQDDDEKQTTASAIPQSEQPYRITCDNNRFQFF